jgi:hypothetical protein
MGFRKCSKLDAALRGIFNKVSNRVFSLSLNSNSFLKESQLRTSANISHTTMARVIPLVYKTPCLIFQQLTISVIDTLSLACIQSIYFILLCPLTELEIFKNVKIFSGLSLAL